MITKERLQKLIGLGKTIYTPDKLWETIGDIKLNKSFTINNNRLQSSINYEDIPVAIGYMSVPLEDLYENKEDAKFIVKMCTQRIEMFEPPIWKDFVEMEEFCFFQKNHKQTIIRVIGTKYLVVETNFERYYTGDLTKENYILACQKAKELFLGQGETNE